MSSEHGELQETFGSDDVTLRMALAEAEMEISLLKIELMRTRQKLERVEAALRTQSERPPTQSGLPSEEEQAPMESEVVPRQKRNSAPPSVRPRDKICARSGFHGLEAAGSLEAALRAAAER
jgi:hypothetical protein